MDVNSGSIHVVDDVVYDLIPLVEPLVAEGVKDAAAVREAVRQEGLPYSAEEIGEADRKSVV